MPSNWQLEGKMSKRLLREVIMRKKMTDTGVH